MREMRRRSTTSARVARGSRLAALLLAITSIVAVLATPARAAMGYELSTSNPVLVGGIEFVHGVAVDQVNHRVYIAVVSNNVLGQQPGEIRRFESNGSPAGTFGGGPQALFGGVAVNPVTQGFYGAQIQVQTPIGLVGTAQMSLFSSAGASQGSFPLGVTESIPQIATDSAGDVYYPNIATDSVQVFNSAGVLQEEIGCGACPGGAFGTPVSVAINSKGDLYVADIAPDRVVKLTLSGGAYGYDSILQSGRGAAAVGVDPSTDDVFVGNYPNGTRYHIVAYDSTGVQFDDFGAGLFIDPPLGALGVAQIAADATTHKLYVTETSKVYVFDRVTIGPPTASADPASTVGQLSATLNATVNAKGHAVLECKFEYTEDADVSFTNATSLPCPTLPDGSGSTALVLKVSGLSPDTAYRYRVAAKNNGGSITSPSQTFETPPAIPPTVTTEAPTAVTQTTATIKGTVNPHGGSASDCHFEFGTSVAYGSSIACPALPEPVVSDVTASKSVTKLAPDTTYHYRLVVGTNAGTTEGDDVEFTTPSPPVEPEPQPEPQPGPTLPPAVTTPPVATTPPAPRPLRCKKGFRKKRVRGKMKCVKKKRASKPRRGHGGHR